MAEVMRCGACREELTSYEVEPLIGDTVQMWWVHKQLPKDPHPPVPVLTQQEHD